MLNKLKLYDTTLRDGNQALNVSFSLEDKLLIAEKLDALGIHYIEGGWPNPTNHTDVAFYREARTRPFKARIAAFGSTRKPYTTPARDPVLRTLLSARTPVITIFGKSWDLHVARVIRTSQDENLRMIESSVAYLARRCDEVIFDAEHFFDGYRANPGYALRTIRAAADAGAGCIVLCDTNGGMLPMDIQAMFAAVRKEMPGISLGIHTHNDSGNGVANTLVAVHEGCLHVQGTINGLGERCGNADLCAIIPDLALKMNISCITPKQLTRLTATSLFVSEVANLQPDIRQPYVGECAFTHKGGAHIDGVVKHARSFEHEQPAAVGNERRYVLSSQSGSSAIVEKLKKLRPTLNKKSPLVKSLLAQIKEMEHAGYQFEAAEGSFQLLAKKALGMFREQFKFKGFRVIVEKREDGSMFSEATIKVKRGNTVVHTAAEGDGPVDALNNAVRKALGNLYPRIKDVRLEDFKVRILNGRDGTTATTRVLIESHDGADHWGTVGVSPNIIEASWIALTDSLNYKLMKP